MILRFRFITFIFLLAIAPLGCAITNKEAVLNEGEHMLVRKLDAVLLAADDLPTMEVDGTVNHRKRGIVNQPLLQMGLYNHGMGLNPKSILPSTTGYFGALSMPRQPPRSGEVSLPLKPSINTNPIRSMSLEMAHGALKMTHPSGL